MFEKQYAILYGLWRIRPFFIVSYCIFKNDPALAKMIQFEEINERNNIYIYIPTG